ncbi:MAG: iron-only hydrogenase system regulator [Lachnospiraceae bacterium]|nr:iron-only hydrogenase system regulator [Lachnospiraceae bacterium]
MSSRLAVISIIVENPDSVEAVNKLLHDASKYIIGRMGVPYREKGISLISVALDAPQDTISALSGSIGRLNGVSSKTAYSNVVTEDAGE